MSRLRDIRWTDDDDGVEVTLRLTVTPGELGRIIRLVRDKRAWGQWLREIDLELALANLDPEPPPPASIWDRIGRE